ncbi:hypothetical protein [Cryptosporangium minutisporangium]|uniref:Uncharacterized protein n=1 Tax=Cryptosporangium minutisporangium TaxID=113569 RepID=A0ABP6TC67_9ACTN
MPASEVPAPLRGPESPKDEEEEKKGFLGVSAPQVMAGALAAATSAVAASYLGVAGTVLGAGLGSVIATVSTAVYQKSIQRSNKVLQRVVVTTVTGAQPGVDDVVHAGRDSTVMAPDPSLPNAAQAGRGLPDPHLAETHHSDAAPDPSRAETHVMGAVPDATRPFGVPVDESPGVDARRPAYGSASVPPPDRPTGRVYGGGTPWHQGLPWKRIAITSAALFILVMGVITTFELIQGRTVADAVNNEKGNGTTVGRVVTKDNSGPASPTPSEAPSSEEATPSETPSEEFSPSDELSESPSDQPSDTPNPDGSEGSSDEQSEQPAPAETQGYEESASSAPAQPMGGSVSTVPSASPLG